MKIETVTNELSVAMCFVDSKKKTFYPRKLISIAGVVGSKHQVPLPARGLLVKPSDE